MSELRNDYSVLKKLGLDLPPIGVKYCFNKPEDISPLEYEAKLSLCEMLKMSQAENRCFYFSKEHNETCVGKVILGMEDMEPFAASGQIGPKLGVFDDARCNQRLYQSVPNLALMPLQLEGHKGKASYYAEFECIMAELAPKT